MGPATPPWCAADSIIVYLLIKSEGLIYTRGRLPSLTTPEG